MGLPVYDNIDRLLKAKNMSRRRLAIAAGINESTISVAFVKKNTMFHPANLKKIADALGVTTDELIAEQPAEVEHLGKADGVPAAFVNPSKGHKWRRSDGSEVDGHVWTDDELRAEIAGDVEKLNLRGKKAAMQHIKELIEIPRYTEPDQQEEKPSDA